MDHSVKKLPDAELWVMQLVWRFPPPVPRAVIEQAAAESRPMAQTTLLTQLTRLAKTGFLRVEKQGRSSIYTPLVSRKEYGAVQSRRFLDTIFSGSISAFANALCDKALTPEELDELRRLLEEKRK